jgi:ribosomal protein L9
MDVILLQDVAKVGKHKQVVTVSAGYGAFLVSQKRAVVATPSAIKSLRNTITKTETEQKAYTEALIATLKRVDGKKVVYRARANMQGHLFAALHPKIHNLLLCYLWIVYNFRCL